MVNNQYQLIGTDTIFEITGDDGGYWKITVKSPKGQEVNVHMTKQALTDSVNDRYLVKKI